MMIRSLVSDLRFDALIDDFYDLFIRNCLLIGVSGLRVEGGFYCLAFI